MEIIDNSLVEPVEIRMIRPSKFPVRYKLPANSPELTNGHQKPLVKQANLHFGRPRGTSESPK